jgi:hypothetical protein
MDKLRKRGALKAIGWCLLAGALPVQAAGEFQNLPWGEKLATVGILLTISVCVAVGMLALLLVYGLLRPAVIRGGSDRLRAHPKRSLLVGILGLVLLIAVIALLQAFPEPIKGLGGLVLLAAALYLMVSGAAIIAYDLGDRLLANVGARCSGSSFMAVLWGGLLLLLLGFVPVLGALIQFVALVLGFGLALSGLVDRSGPPPAPESEPTPQEEDTAP